MDISIIIPCLNESENIKACILSLVHQQYQKGKFEIIAVDGGSNDGTLEILDQICFQHSNVHIVKELKKGTAAGRNAGIKNAKYEFIALIDADCEAPGNWLQILSDNFEKNHAEDPCIVAVGGANLPPGNANNFVKAIGIVMDSFPGSFNSAQGRRFKKSVYVESLANLNALYKKDGMAKIGYYDETLGSEAEDADLNYRLKIRGAKFLYIYESFVWHKMRPNKIQWLRNMFRYGKGRARLLKRYPGMWSINFCLPLIFILSFLVTPLSYFSQWFLSPFLYFPAIIFYSAFQCIKQKSRYLFWDVVNVYIIQHFGYAAGELAGLSDSRVR